MARWKVALLTAAALVPAWFFDSRQRGMVIGTAAFSVLLLVTPRRVAQRKWFLIATVATALIVLPSVSALASGRLDLLPFAIGLSAVMGIGIYLFARPWPLP